MAGTGFGMESSACEARTATLSAAPVPASPFRLRLWKVPETSRPTHVAVSLPRAEALPVASRHREVISPLE